MTDLTMSQFASKDDLLAAQAARIAELESQLEAIGAGGVEPLRKPAAAQQAVQPVAPDDWRDQFSESVYEDLSAACNQDVPLEEYPARILNILDAIVGPRHPTVIKWRNDAIRSCIAIAYKYCSDPESYRYLKQDLEAMLAAPAHPAEGVPPQASEWDGKLPERLQSVLNALRLELPAAVVNDVEFEVRSHYEAMHTSLSTSRRMYGAARDRLEAIDAAQPDPFAATQPAAQGMDAPESEYQRGYRHGYNRRDAEVQGALL